MNRRMLLICAATLPLFLAAVVVQTIQYQDLKTQVAAQQKEQESWIEKNRRILAGVTVLSSPERIDRLAQQDPGLQQTPANQTLKVHFPDAGASK